MQLTADDIIRFAKRNEGREFVEIEGNALFSIKAENGGVTFATPKGIGLNDREKIGEYVELFNQLQDFEVSPYREKKLKYAPSFLGLVREVLNTAVVPADVVEPSVQSIIAPLAKPKEIADIESEIRTILIENAHEDSKPERDAELVSYYYGLREEPWPSTKTSASAHGLTTRQGADLVIGKFLGKARRARSGGASPFKSIDEVARILSESVPIAGSDLISELEMKGILVGPMSTKGLLVLLKDFGLCDEVDLYTASLERIASRERFLACEEVYFIGKNEVGELKVILEEIRSAPGLVGLANFRVVEEIFPLLPKAKLSFMKQLIFGMPHAWTSAAGADLWFMFEDRRNAMISYLKRVHFVTDSCSIRELSETLRDALDERSEPDGRPYLP